jgi:hypothetical protein
MNGLFLKKAVDRKGGRRMTGALNQKRTTAGGATKPTKPIP